jgi:hypothetical protein
MPVILEINLDDKASPKVKVLGEEVKKTFKTIETESRKSADGIDIAWSSALKKVGGYFAAAFAVSKIEHFVSESIEAYSKYEHAAKAVDVISKSLGYDTQQVLDAIDSLTNDGLLPFSVASENIKKLMQTGLEIPQIVNLLEAFKARSAFARDSSIDFSESVRNLTQSFMTEQSRLARLSGQYTSYTDLIKLGADAMGKSVDALTDAEREQAKYLGVLKDTQPFLKNTAEMQEEIETSVNKANKEWNKTKRMVGEEIAPIYKSFLDDILIPLNKEINELFKDRKEKDLEEHAEELRKIMGDLVEKPDPSQKWFDPAGYEKKLKAYEERVKGTLYYIDDMVITASKKIEDKAEIEIPIKFTMPKMMTLPEIVSVEPIDFYGKYVEKNKETLEDFYEWRESRTQENIDAIIQAEVDGNRKWLKIKQEEVDREQYIKDHSLSLAAEGLTAFAAINKDASKENFKIWKAFALTQAMIDMPAAILSSYRKAGGFPWGIIPAGITAAYAMQQINAIRKQEPSFHTGGYVSAQIEPGEVIIRKERVAEMGGVAHVNERFNLNKYPASSSSSTTSLTLNISTVIGEREWVDKNLIPQINALVSTYGRRLAASEVRAA